MWNPLKIGVLIESLDLISTQKNFSLIKDDFITHSDTKIIITPKFIDSRSLLFRTLTEDHYVSFNLKRLNN